MGEYSDVIAPSSVNVGDRKPVLYTADGKPLVRLIGFRPELVKPKVKGGK
jgi:hypothetical protein